MDKDRIAAYRASRITRDFTDELLDAYERLEAQCLTWEGRWRGAQEELYALSDCIHQMRTTYRLNQHAQEWARFVEEYVNVPTQAEIEARIKEENA